MSNTIFDQHKEIIDAIIQDVLSLSAYLTAATANSNSSAAGIKLANDYAWAKLRASVNIEKSRSIYKENNAQTKNNQPAD